MKNTYPRFLRDKKGIIMCPDQRKLNYIGLQKFSFSIYSINKELKISLHFNCLITLNNTKPNSNFLIFSLVMSRQAVSVVSQALAIHFMRYVSEVTNSWGKDVISVALWVISYNCPFRTLFTVQYWVIMNNIGHLRVEVHYS